MTAGLVAFLDAQMADAETQWSVGTFGAIAEFARDAAEPVALSRSAASLAAVTERGGIRIDAARRHAAVRLRDHDERQLEPPRRALPARA